MARKPLRSQLNQIRAWVRQGRTDAWIAHQLDVSTAELREFRRRHELSADDESDAELDLRDEIEAEIEATMAEEDDGEDDEDEEGDEEDEEPEGDGDDGDDGEDGEDGEEKPKRRRRRRGGRGRSKRPGASMEATFDHGDEGYGLWLDPAIADDPVYSEHWAGQREVEVVVEPDRIVIRRTQQPD
jgi:hypothetical protein